MIAIIKYNAGNITSVVNAVERSGFKCIVTDDKDQIRSADKVIFPGVGEASSAMKYLKENGLDELIKSLKQVRQMLFSNALALVRHNHFELLCVRQNMYSHIDQAIRRILDSI